MVNDNNTSLKNILTTVQTAPTLTKVAEWLYTSQPNISKTISEAEKKYGVQLVNRDRTPISLTAAGERLLERLEQILSLEQSTMNEMASFQRNPPIDLKIAFFPTYAPIILPEIYPVLKNKYPRLQVTTSSFTTTKALERLKDGQVSILIGRNANDPRIASRHLFTEKLCFVISQSSPLFRSDVFAREISASDLIQLQQENYIKWTTETAFINVTEHFFQINDLHFSSKLTVSTYEEAMLCAAQGLGTTMAMLHTADKFLTGHKNVNLLIIPEKLSSLEISLMIRKNSDIQINNIAKDISNSLLKIIITD